jgi:hypothetical protein
VHIERADCVLVMRGHEHDPARDIVAERLEDAEAVLVGHLDVEEQQIRPELPDEKHRLFPVRRLTDDLDGRMFGE